MDIASVNRRGSDHSGFILLRVRHLILYLYCSILILDILMNICQRYCFLRRSVSGPMTLLGCTQSARSRTAARPGDSGLAGDSYQAALPVRTGRENWRPGINPSRPTEDRGAAACTCAVNALEEQAAGGEGSCLHGTEASAGRGAHHAGLAGRCTKIARTDRKTLLNRISGISGNSGGDHASPDSFSSRLTAITASFCKSSLAKTTH